MNVATRTTVLAAAIQHILNKQAARALDDQVSGGRHPALMDRTAQLIPRLNGCRGDPLQVGGLFAHLAYEAARLRRSNGAGDSLREFLDGDEATYNTKVQGQQ